MLRDAFEDAAPYISNLKAIREFVEEYEARGIEDILAELENRVESSPPTLATDYRILLEKFEQIINKGK